MNSTCFCVFTTVLTVILNGSSGADFKIFLQVTHNSTPSQYKEDMDVNFKVGDTVGFVCDVSEDLYNSPGFRLILTKDGNQFRSTQEKKIDTFMTLQKSDDGAELRCDAESRALRKILSISAHFNEITNNGVFLIAKPNFLKIFLLALGGLFLLCTTILVCYGVLQHFQKKQSNIRNGPGNVTLETSPVKYSQIDLNKIRKNSIKLSINEPDYTEIGFTKEVYGDNDTTKDIDKPNITTKKSDKSNIPIEKSDTLNTDEIANQKSSHRYSGKNSSELNAINTNVIGDLVAKFNKNEQGTSNHC